MRSLPALLFVLLLTSSFAAAQRPNFLLIIADDLCWRDLGYEGNAEVKTPNLDKLRTESMHLRGMFNPATTCSPTRHALYTGLYPIRSGAYPNHTRVYDGTKSLFTHLKDAGYRVALQNKEHVGPKPSFPYEHIEGADDLTVTKSFVTRDASQPWFMVFASNDPHGPWTRGPKYDPTKLTIPPYLHDNKITRDLLAAYYGEITKLDEQVGALMKLLNDTQQAENTLVMFVSEQGSSFPYGGKWSVYDNGIHASALVRWPGKVKPGSSSKALMQYVDVPPTFLDAAGIDPTRIDVSCPDANGATGFDGISFLPVLRGEIDRLRDYVFAQHTTLGTNGALEAYPMRMVRDARYKLIRNLAPENTYTIGGIHQGQPIESWKADAENNYKLADRVKWLFKRPGEELYDLQSDPEEMKNLAEDPEFETIKARLQTQLDAWVAQQKDHGMETENLASTRQGKSDDEPRKAKKKGKKKAAK
ncbi:sulfatase [Prosthecobacter sp.]|uniref:sulfatase family protein n=1 Tax=Prosthecobacter sp. TaxID=1965333 RepID=UPI001D6E55D7|nr:sulfatase [Prosthecobacter sp.]MCB1278650.1 sulfatase [Prosthecobacter sp.]